MNIKSGQNDDFTGTRIEYCSVPCKKCDKFDVTVECAVQYEDGNIVYAEPVDESEAVCERCRERIDYNEWRDNVTEQLELAFEEGGWSIDDWKVAQTNTEYYYVSRYRDETEEEIEELKIRVSDHGTAYATEDFSIAKNPNPDDHDLNYVLEYLRK